MRKRNGFTLIELLAIIVILAIIAVITVPIILGIIENSKKGAAIDSAYGYKEAIQKFYALKMLEDNNYKINDDEYDINYYIEQGIDVNGEKPSDGWVMIENNNVTDFSLKIGDYVVTYDSSTNTTVAVKGGEVPLTPTQSKAKTYLTILKTAKGNVSDIFNLPVEGVSSTDVTSGWVALNNGEVIGYSLQVGDKTTALSTKDASVGSIVETLAQAYINSLTIPNSETVVDITESGYLKSGFIEYKSNNSTIIINDYSLKYEIDGITKYANYDKTNEVLVVENIEHNRPISVGQTIYIGDERFYVMAIKNGTATLLARNCLIKNGDIWKQSNNTGVQCSSAAFSRSNYWHDLSSNVLKDEYAKDINGNTASYSGSPYPYIYYIAADGSDDSNYIADIVDAYALTLSPIATGRLLTYEEATGLDVGKRFSYRNYWIGSVYDDSHVWYVDAGGKASLTHTYAYRSTYCVRPVIEIPTSEIQ